MDTFEEKKVTYGEAFETALSAGWGEIIVQDTVCGNGFDILLYGLRLIAIYAVKFTLRLLIAVLAPLSALLVMKAEKSANEARRRAWQRVNDDL